MKNAAFIFAILYTHLALAKSQVSVIWNCDGACYTTAELQKEKSEIEDGHLYEAKALYRNEYTICSADRNSASKEIADLVAKNSPCGQAAFKAPTRMITSCESTLVKCTQAGQDTKSPPQTTIDWATSKQHMEDNLLLESRKIDAAESKKAK